jgi:beta-N-acetylhexosaminidase
VTHACIFGLAGAALDAEELAFFRDVRPWGFILFRRNVETPDQVRRLADGLRSSIDDPAAPILIDQEGGRVQRLGPPHWPAYPAARACLGAGGGLAAGRELARLSARVMAADLADLGITVDCAPVCDVPTPGSHDIVGDRAYSEDPREVAVLARAAAEGLIAGGVLPVIKHVPGHGRAKADSHAALPVVEASLDDLENTDFLPFRALSDMPIAMTAHVVYASVEARRPATTSALVIASVIRQRIGFEGLLISDDLSMKALDGDIATRARRAHRAGCDVVLHCNGDAAEMQAVARGSRTLRGSARARAAAALGRLPRSVEPIDMAEARARLAALVARALR